MFKKNIFTCLFLIATTLIVYNIHSLKIKPYEKKIDLENDNNLNKNLKTDEQIAIELQREEYKTQKENAKLQIKNDELLAIQLQEQEKIVKLNPKNSILNLNFDKEINNLINALKKEIGEDLNLKITNPCEGSIEIIFNTSEDNKYITVSNKKEIIYPNLNYFINKKHSGIDKDTENLIKEFSYECINNFSNNDEPIIFTGFGANLAYKEFSILFSILEKTSNIKLENIHLIDPAYNDLISKFSNKKLSLNYFQLFNDNHDDFLKETIMYVYLLNKKLKNLNSQDKNNSVANNTQIRLFLHNGTNSYLECKSICNLKKINCLASLCLPLKEKKSDPELDLITLILRATSNYCLFLRNGYLNEEGSRMEPKILDQKNKNIYITKRLNIFTNQKETKEYMHKVAKESK